MKMILTGPLNLYVDGASGNDATGDGTQGGPYKTIQRAINAIPPVLMGYDAVINVAAGTYPETVAVYGKAGGAVILRAYTGAITLTGVWVAYGVSCFIRGAITVDAQGGAIALRAESGGLIRKSDAEMLTVKNVNYYAIAAYADGNIVLENSVTITDVNVALYTESTGRMYCGTVTLSGSVSVFALSRQGDIKYGNAIGTPGTMFSTQRGGRILSGGQTSYPNY